MSAPDRPYELLDLNDDEQRWIDQHLQIYTELSESAKESDDPAEEDGGFNHLAFLDNLLLGWRESPEDERADANTMVTMTGLVLGQMLTQVYQLRWAGYRDTQGTDLCLTTAPGVELNGEHIDFTLFPISSVAKRLDSDEDQPITRFFIGVMDMLDEKAPGLRRKGMEQL